MRSNGGQFHLKHHTRRARQHRWQDGIFELLIGIGLILYALFLSLRIEFLVSEVRQIIADVWMAAVAIFCGIMIFRFISEHLKENLAYPRTGWVNLKSQRQKPSVRSITLAVLAVPVFVIIGLVVIVGVLYLFALLHINLSLVLLSAMVAFPAVVLARRTGLRRFYGLAGGILLVGGILTATHTFGKVGVVLLYGLTGVLVSLSGGLTLAVYLRQHPVHAEEEAVDGNL